MICFIRKRPALQIGRHQVIDYDTSWLGDALRRAARAAEREDFPFVDDIRSGIETYLESRCPLQLLPIDELYGRMKRMLEKIGCEGIAEKLQPLAPPVTVSLSQTACEVGTGFELGFFSRLDADLRELRAAGVERIAVVGLRDCVLALCGSACWDKPCEKLCGELREFLSVRGVEIAREG